MCCAIDVEGGNWSLVDALHFALCSVFVACDLPQDRAFAAPAQ
jgi:hypothetical protein